MKRCFTLWQFPIITVCVILLSGCKSLKQTVEVPVYVHDTAYLAKEVHDSTFIDRWHTVEPIGRYLSLTKLPSTVTAQRFAASSSFMEIEPDISAADSSTVHSRTPDTAFAAKGFSTTVLCCIKR